MKYFTTIISTEMEKRITYTETINPNEGQRDAGAYCPGSKETSEILNKILQSVIDAAKEAKIKDI